jgi:hypothetical protein
VFQLTVNGGAVASRTPSIDTLMLETGDAICSVIFVKPATKSPFCGELMATEAAAAADAHNNAAAMQSAATTQFLTARSID